jgi:putative transposase
MDMKHTGERKTIRLKDYDYSSPGEYFVTICSQDKICLFGHIVKEEMQLSIIGDIAQRCWLEIPNHFPNVELDAFVVMPNHIHGIIIIQDSRRDVVLNVPESSDPENHSVHENNNPTSDVQLNVPTRFSPRRGTLSVIIRTFKGAVTLGCRRRGFSDFNWQPRFYEHIVRDDKDLNIIRDYIANNPIQWASDEDNLSKDNFHK